MKLHYQNLTQLYQTDNTELISASCSRLLSPWVEDRIKFAFNDPASFSDGSVDPDVFIALLSNLIDDATLSDGSLIKLVNLFSAACNKTEWHNFYQPILQRKNDHNIHMGAFNIVADIKWMVKPFTPPELDIRDIVDGYLYAYNSTWDMVYIMVFSNHVEVLDSQFMSLDHDEICKACETLCRHSDIQYPLVITALCINNELSWIDAFTLSHIGIWPSPLRRSVAEQCFTKVMDGYEGNLISLGDGIEYHNTDISSVTDEFNNLGYNDISQLLLVTNDALYSDAMSLISI